MEGVGEREGGREMEGGAGGRERQGKYKQRHMYMYMYNLRSVLLPRMQMALISANTRPH